MLKEMNDNNNNNNNSTKKKRKGGGYSCNCSCGTDDDNDSTALVSETTRKKGSRVRKHLSLEDYCVKSKRNKCSDDVNVVGDRGVATVPPCVGLSSSVLEPSSRGLKRKIGCIDVKTQIGSRKNKLEDDYEMVEAIGRGKFGSVWLCKCKANGREFACKTLKKGEETVHKEVEIMQHLSGHPGIVMLNAVYEDEESFHLVMELCNGGRLIDQLTKEGRFSEQRAARVMKELMLVIKYCHEMGVVHRDVKPENILMTSSGKMKLADFGLAMRVASGQSLTGIAGSPCYVAPEVLSGSYREKVDIWSAGILFHALLTGALPFQGKSLESVFEAIKSTSLDFNSGVCESVSRPARDLLGKMLTRDVSTRFSADEVLGHPFVLFHTERILSIKSKPKSVSLVPSQLVVSTSLPESDRRRSSSGLLTEASSLVVTSKRHTESEKSDDCGIVDALTAAISQVRISEPKRSRLCVPGGTTIKQQFSANSLCEAF